LIYVISSLFRDSLSATRAHAPASLYLLAIALRQPTCSQSPIQPSRPLWSAKGATGAGCGVMLAVWRCRNAISIHASISS